MKIFISWSGETSKAVAEALHGWLPSVIQAVKPWLSQRDIEKGSRWSSELTSQLANAEFGIICLTPDNLNEPWIHFEAGALSKTVDSSRVCTFLLDLSPNDVGWPLAQFQATKAIKEDTKLLVETINKALGGEALPASLLERAFERSWQELQTNLEKIQKRKPSEPPVRSNDEKIEEILTLVRGLSNESLGADLRDLKETLVGARFVENPPTHHSWRAREALIRGLAGAKPSPQSDASLPAPPPTGYFGTEPIPQRDPSLPAPPPTGYFGTEPSPQRDPSLPAPPPTGYGRAEKKKGE